MKIRHASNLSTLKEILMLPSSIKTNLSLMWIQNLKHSTKGIFLCSQISNPHKTGGKETKKVLLTNALEAVRDLSDLTKAQVVQLRLRHLLHNRGTGARVKFKRVEISILVALPNSSRMR